MWGGSRDFNRKVKTSEMILVKKLKGMENIPTGKSRET